VKRKLDITWIKRWQAIALALGCLIVDFILGAFIFWKLWQLPPAWGDVPTWLAVTVGAVGGWIALSQLRILQRQIADEAERGVARDELVDKQLAEAEARAVTERRRQAEDIDLGFTGSTGYVVNNSLGIGHIEAHSRESSRSAHDQILAIARLRCCTCMRSRRPSF
jgi:hypothetical protein